MLWFKDTVQRPFKLNSHIDLTYPNQEPFYGPSKFFVFCFTLFKLNIGIGIDSWNWYFGWINSENKSPIQMESSLRAASCLICTFLFNQAQIVPKCETTVYGVCALLRAGQCCLIQPFWGSYIVTNLSIHLTRKLPAIDSAENSCLFNKLKHDYFNDFKRHFSLIHWQSFQQDQIQIKAAILGRRG